MKLKFVILICCFAAVWGSWAKSETKLPDSYAFTRGVEAYNEEKYADAMDWLEREVSEHPDNGYAYLYISIIRTENQEYGRSLSAIDNAINKIPKKDKTGRAISFATRAGVYAIMEDTIKALDDMSKAIQIDPSNPLYYDSRAQLHYEQKNYALADADYKKMINLDQGDVKGYMGIGRNANAEKRWDDAIKQFDYVIRLAPDYSSGYSFRAEAFIGQGNWAGATDDIVKALDIDGDDKAFYLMSVLPKEASGLLKSKLKIQMAKQSSNRYWPYCLGSLALANDDFDEAIPYFEKGNVIDASPVFMERIARCYMEKMDYQSALDYIDRALDMNPEDYDVISLKADALGRLGRFDECIAERDRYVAQFPDYFLSYLNRAENLTEARRFNDAIEDYNTAVVLMPPLAEYPYLLMKRGDALRFVGKNEEAKRDYEHLLTVEKDSVLSASSWTPFAYSGLGNTEKAIETMQAIIANDTTDISGTLYNAACIYARIGQKQEAIGYLKKAIENGYKHFQHIHVDYDLDCLRDMPEYETLIQNLPSATPAPVADPSTDETNVSFETVEIPFTKENGVTKVKCSINGLPLHFVFNTGAADVTMSMVEANFMLKNDYIMPADIIGAAHYIDANGDITEGTVVNLRKVDFGGLELENVRASVVRNQKAPLLLGQSVLGRLGKIEIDNPAMKLIITHKANQH